MNTIADFKRNMIKGAKVTSKLYWKTGEEWILKQEHQEREVSIVQSNSFALKTYQPNKGQWVDSWCAWPKKSEFKAIDQKTAQIEENGIRLIYQFL